MDVFSDDTISRLKTTVFNMKQLASNMSQPGHVIPKNTVWLEEFIDALELRAAAERSAAQAGVV